MLLPDEICELLEPEARITVGLGERYRCVLFGEEKFNAILCNVWLEGRMVPRLEALVMDSSDSMTLVLDGSSTMAISVGDFRKLIPFLSQALVN